MKGPLRVAVVDDEPLAREALRLLLATDPEVTVAFDCIGIDAPALIERLRPDLLFLDVQMPEVDGFQVLEAVDPAALPATVFVTAHGEYAVRAFEVHAIDYLQKPFDDARFFKALARAKERLRLAGATDAADRLLALLGDRAAGRQPIERFLVRERGRVIVVRADEVDWIESADYYATLHVGGASHLLRQTMADLEASLDPRRFVRVHRKAIVNIDRVREVHPLFRGDCMLVLEGGTQVKLSRTRRDDFERLLAAPRPR
jgi:two-component system, LytTR family, response regulator